MKSGTQGFIGERLREAREARGLLSASLAGIVGVSAPAMTQYEKGLQSPRPDVMERLASVLCLPLRFFLTPRGTDPGVVFWRSLESATKTRRIVAERRLSWVQDISHVLTHYVEFPLFNVPDCDLPRDPSDITDAQIEQAANQTRSHWGIGDGTIPNVTLLLEKHGIVIAREDLAETTLDALAKWCPRERSAYCLLSSGKESAVRARYNLLHELGHLALHRNLDRWHLENSKLHSLIEKQAFKFAGAFAMPAEAFAADVFSFSPDAFVSLKSKWKFSVGAMIKRCEDLGILREATAQKLWRSLVAQGWRLQEPLDDSIQHEHPRLLKQSIIHLIEAGVLRPETVEDFFILAQEDVEQLTGHDFESAHPVPNEKLVVMPQSQSKSPRKNRASQSNLFSLTRL